MASQGPLFPGTVTTETGPSGDNDWLNASNVGADDGSEAQITAATFDAGDHSFRLKAQNFGFTIPAGATIDGITVEIERRDFAGDAQDQEVRLYDSTGTLVGTDKQTATSWPATATIATYGGSADTWSAGLDVDDINSANFGVALIALANSANTDIGVDFIRVTVHYTPSPNVTLTPDPVTVPLVAPAPVISVSPAEPADAYGQEVFADNPSAWYRMGEASGSVLDYMLGTAGVANGTVTRDVAGATGDSDDGAILFDGSTGYVSVADHDGLDMGDVFSIELWIKRDRSGAVTEEPITKGSNAPTVSIVNDKVGLYMFGVGNSVEQAGSITDTTGFHHIVVTHDGTTSKIYIDGVDDSGASTNRAFASNTTALNIGRNTGASNYFDGTIDEVAFYKSVLSSTRVAAHYAAISSGAVTVTPSPVAVPLAIPAPSLQVGRVLTPAAVAVPLVIPAPGVQVTKIVTPSPVAILLAVPTPSIAAGALVAPSPVTVVLAVPVPTITADPGAGATNVNPDPVVIVLAAPAPSLQVSALVAPSPVAVPLVIPSPAIAVGALVAPSPVAVPLIVPAPIIRAGALVAPSPVTIPLAVPIPTIVSGRLVSPSPVAVTLAIPIPTITVLGALPPGFLDELLELAIAGDLVTVEDLDGSSAGVVIVVTIAGVEVDTGGVLELDVEG